MNSTHVCIFISAILLLQLAVSADDGQNSTDLERTGKQFLFPIFGVGLVRFANDPCSGYGGLIGTCLTRRQCSELSGVPSGRCASSIGVCCVVTRNCGESSQINNTYFVSPGFPTRYTTGGVCTYTIQKIDASVCQVRIDFLTLRLAQPNTTGSCTTDAVIIQGGASTVPILCGDNSGQHVYVDFNGAANIIISIATTGDVSRSWNIRVAQINCNCPYKAPSGCLQFYNSSSGTVTSFNYGSAANQDSTRQLTNENYGICVAMQNGFCGITWSQTSTLSFAVSGDTYTAITDATIGTAAAAVTACTTDFVVIPSPILADGTASASDRFCGNGFQTVTSYSKPFVLTVVTDADETNDLGNVGFSLNFAQVACPVIPAT